MAKHLNKGLSYNDWPAEDRAMFENLIAKKCGDEGPWFQPAQGTVRSRRYAYAHWLGFLKRARPGLLEGPPATRVTRELVKQYVLSMRVNCTETTIAIQLQRLHVLISTAIPNEDWTWLFKLTRRIRKRAVPAPKAYVLSVDLYELGLQLMQEARDKAIIFDRTILSQAEQYRDGLMIAFLAEAPMRRDGFARLCLNEHVVKIGGLWRVYLSADMVKTGIPESFQISEDVGRCIDEYIQTYRAVFPNAHGHNGMWPYRDGPMTDKMVRRYLRKHTEARLGTAVSPHGFRRAAASFLAAADPKNIRVAKDLLQHRSFAMTEKHYVHGANTRLAGQTLAQIIAQRSADGG